MQDCFVKTAKNPIVIDVVKGGDYKIWSGEQSERLQNWIADTGFLGQKTGICLCPSETGQLEKVIFYVPKDGAMTIYDWARLPELLMPYENSRIYDLSALKEPEFKNAVLGWGLQCYRFDRYKSEKSPPFPRLLCARLDLDDVEESLTACILVRDLINTPARDLGPDGLSDAAATLSENHGADCHVIVGEDLLDENYPAIHVVGAGASRAPRLIDLKWGRAEDPKVTLVGKGVCFDTGGLDLKSAANMKLMKKDMGGAAHVLGLASMIMSAGLAVNLRVLIPAVENSVSANAYRPSDVVPSRKGLNIEISNTDAEGRVVLADALTAASEDDPELLVDFATLTGAARVALGTDVPALFCNTPDVADNIVSLSKQVDDALWSLPLWSGYQSQINSQIADIDNAPEGGYGGAITAALFLERFVKKSIDWVHIDVMAWNLKSAPGRPQGGEAMGMRAVYAYIKDRFDR